MKRNIHPLFTWFPLCEEIFALYVHVELQMTIYKVIHRYNSFQEKNNEITDIKNYLKILDDFTQDKLYSH